MQRVVVVGRAGAGKTYVSSELSRRTGIPVIHLDRIFWREHWRPAPRDEAVAELERAVQQERWIVDGDFFDDAGPIVFPQADLVVFLDVPRLLCVWRVLARRVKDAGRERPDLPAPEGFDWALIRWIWNWDETDRAKLLRHLNENKQLDVFLTSTSEGTVDRILAGE